MNKEGKSGERHGAVGQLEARIGNLSLVKAQGPLCAGQFNSSLGRNVSKSKIYLNLNKIIKKSSGKYSGPCPS